MRIFLTLTVGISLIVLASGTIVYIENPTFGGGLGLVAAWGAMAFITFFYHHIHICVRRRTKK